MSEGADRAIPTATSAAPLGRAMRSRGQNVIGTPVFCSWSGGKDSALALYEAVGAGATPCLLLTMMTETGARSRSHGLHATVLQAQADAAALPIRFGSATWSGYDATFAGLAGEAAAAGARAGVFGDLDTVEHREWAQQVCSAAGMAACLPLWRRDRARVVSDLLDAGFQAIVVAVRDGVLPARLLGRTIDRRLLRELRDEGVDAAGENGEYHTLVVDGPLFRHPLDVTPGETVLRDGVWYLDVR